MYSSSDPKVRQTARAVFPQGWLWQIWTQAKGELRTKDLEAGRDLSSLDLREVSTEAWRRRELVKWSKLRPQGIGVEVFMNDKVSNSWLQGTNSRGMRESERILALKLRTSTVPTLTVYARNDGSETTCRLCGVEKETMRHIIGRCASLKLNRMRSHNAVCEFLSAEFETQKWKVYREKKVRTASGTILVPDMIMVRGNLAMIIDVTIRFEADPTALAEAAKVKVQKYEVLREVVPNIYPAVSKVLVRGFPMGARGKWHTGNGMILREAGLSPSRINKVATILSKRTLLQTVDLVKAFRKLSRGGDPGTV